MESQQQYATDSNILLEDISSDEECRGILMTFYEHKLSPDEENVVKQCIAVLSAEIGDEVVFGPDVMADLMSIGLNHPDLDSKVRHVLEYMSLTTETDIDPDCNVQGSIFNYAMCVFQNMQHLTPEELFTLLRTEVPVDVTE